MKQVLSAALSVMFVVSLAGVSSAGMMDTLKGKAEEAKETSDVHKGMDMKGAETGQAIEAQGATKKEAAGMMDEIKEGAKDKVDETKETANETIDNIGK